jgi:MFS family permease
MRQLHLPVLLANLPDARARAFVVLFACDAISRSILITLVPLQAYALFGAARSVSIAYFSVAIVGLVTSLGLPILLRSVPRRWAMTLGVVFQTLSSVLLALGTPSSLIAGLALQTLAAAILEVVINLYMMDHIARRDLNIFEPRRLLFTGTAFAIGPWLGITLHREVLEGLAYFVAILASLTFLTFFWILRLSDNPGIQAAKSVPVSPLRSIPRFVAQPRLVLAWTLALGRNGWWVTFFIYGPIYVAHTGYPPQYGGALVSLGLTAMLLVRVWGRIGRRFGLRNLLRIGYSLTGASSIAAAIAAFADMPLVGMVLIWFAAVSATMIDGAGNVPFLRAVHPYERAAMTSVFMTFRHVGALVVPGTLAVVLWLLPLPSVFVATGAMALAMALLSSSLPRRL